MDQIMRGKVSAGRVVLPAELRKAFGIEDGAEVIFSRTEHGIEIKTASQALRDAQQLFSRLKESGGNVVDELISERRQDALRDYTPRG